MLTACGANAPYAGLAPALARDEAPDTTSVLVMRDGAIVHEAYFRGATAATLHDTRSATKSITALAVGAALGAGLLPSLDAPAFAYLGGAPDDPRKQAITIADLLTMSSALDCDDDVMDSPGNEENMYPQSSWLRWALAIPTRADYARDAAGRGPFHYCTAGVFLLGQVLQAAAGTPVDQLVAKHLFAPLGITQYEFSRSPSGEVMTGGGLRLRTRDLAALAELVRTGGRGLVPADFVRAALTVQRPAHPGQDYGYLLWHRTYETRCGAYEGWFMGGNGGNVIAIIPQLSAVIVVTRTHYNMRGMHQQTTRLLETQLLPALACP